MADHNIRVGLLVPIEQQSPDTPAEEIGTAIRRLNVRQEFGVNDETCTVLIRGIRRDIKYKWLLEPEIDNVSFGQFEVQRLQVNKLQNSTRIEAIKFFDDTLLASRILDALSKSDKNFDSIYINRWNRLMGQGFSGEGFTEASSFAKYVATVLKDGSSVNYNRVIETLNSHGLTLYNGRTGVTNHIEINVSGRVFTIIPSNWRVARREGGAILPSPIIRETDLLDLRSETELQDQDFGWAENRMAFTLKPSGSEQKPLTLSPNAGAPGPTIELGNFDRIQKAVISLEGNRLQRAHDAHKVRLSIPGSVDPVIRLGIISEEGLLDKDNWIITAIEHNINTDNDHYNTNVDMVYDARPTINQLAFGSPVGFKGDDPIKPINELPNAPEIAQYGFKSDDYVDGIPKPETQSLVGGAFPDRVLIRFEQHSTEGLPLTHYKAQLFRDNEVIRERTLSPQNEQLPDIWIEDDLLAEGSYEVRVTPFNVNGAGTTVSLPVSTIKNLPPYVQNIAIYPKRLHEQLSLFEGNPEAQRKTLEVINAGVVDSSTDVSILPSIGAGAIVALGSAGVLLTGVTTAGIGFVAINIPTSGGAFLALGLKLTASGAYKFGFILGNAGILTARVAITIPFALGAGIGIIGGAISAAALPLLIVTAPFQILDILGTIATITGDAHILMFFVNGNGYALPDDVGDAIDLEDRRDFLRPGQQLTEAYSQSNDDVVEATSNPIDTSKGYISVHGYIGFPDDLYFQYRVRATTTQGIGGWLESKIARTSDYNKDWVDQEGNQSYTPSFGLP